MLHSISTKYVAKRQCRVQIKLDVIYSEWCIYCGASYKCCARYCGYFVGSFPWSPPAMEQVGEVNNWSDADGVGCVDAGSSWDNGPSADARRRSSRNKESAERWRTGGEMVHKSEPRREKVTKEVGENRHGFNENRWSRRSAR
ncbi:uncharacterized protein LOC113003799 isoform X2 [Solenopsis invicta]|uniref:uncharacterized protein LOC113003799 isoform X2 n=1 Tax=Solenopsis invicta TaxID=13686 RepID=UPI00193E6B55|nr:uncharacterized protein LOC113003799 isoform X2 [Solenopsis invicta]